VSDHISAILPVATSVLPPKPGKGFDLKKWTTMKGWGDELAARDSSGFLPSIKALDLVVGSIVVR